VPSVQPVQSLVVAFPRQMTVKYSVAVLTPLSSVPQMLK
jgi:hypothetical protein